MRYTESDLRTLLTERAEGPDGGARMEEIVRRSRRIRRARRALATGAAALSVATVALLTMHLPPDGATVAQHPEPMDSVRVESPGPEIPEAFEIRLGVKRFFLPLLHSERFTTMGSPRTVTFTPTSTSTGFKVLCDDPRAWVVIQQRLKGDEPGSSVGRCGGSRGGHHDKRSAPADWLESPQSLEIWVFPADAPIGKEPVQVTACSPGEGTCMATGCPPVEGGCDEWARSRALGDPKVRERLQAEVGGRPGNWAVAIYDRATGSPSG